MGFVADVASAPVKLAKSAAESAVSAVAGALSPAPPSPAPPPPAPPPIPIDLDTTTPVVAPGDPRAGVAAAERQRKATGVARLTRGRASNVLAGALLTPAGTREEEEERRSVTRLLR